MIEVVPFSGNHQTAVVEAILPIQQVEFGIPITLEAQPDLLDIPRFYQTKNGNFWVALVAGQVVGTVALVDIGDAQVALRKMFVKAPFRGREYGIARRLLETVFQWCRERQVREIFLGTTAKFLAAHRFYEKSGFAEIAMAALPPSFPVMSVDTKFYKYAVL